MEQFYLTQKDETLIETTNPGHRELGSLGDERILHIPQTHGLEPNYQIHSGD